MVSPSISALIVQLMENWVFGEAVTDSGEVSTTSSRSIVSTGVIMWLC